MQFLFEFMHMIFSAYNCVLCTLYIAFYFLCVLVIDREFITSAKKS